MINHLSKSEILLNLYLSPFRAPESPWWCILEHWSWNLRESFLQSCPLCGWKWQIIHGGHLFIFFCHLSMSVGKCEKYSFQLIIIAPTFKCLLFVNLHNSFCPTNVNQSKVQSLVPGTRTVAVHKMPFLVMEFLSHSSIYSEVCM